jgi:hypothetical protein
VQRFRSSLTPQGPFTEALLFPIAPHLIAVIPAKAGIQEELAVSYHLTGKSSTVPLHIVFLKALSFVCFLLQEGLFWMALARVKTPAFAGMTEKEVGGDLQAVQEGRNLYSILVFLGL